MLYDTPPREKSMGVLHTVQVDIAKISIMQDKFVMVGIFCRFRAGGVTSLTNLSSSVSERARKKTTKSS
jgi:hypothetical protein